MEINKITLAGLKVACIFNGKNYFFYSEYYGLIAVATRSDNDDNLFSLSVGNKHLDGSYISTGKIEKAAKRFISISENKFIKKFTKYDVSRADLSNNSLKISLC